MGVDRVTKAVGVDYNKPDNSPAVPSQQQAQKFEQQLQQIAPETNPQGSSWHPGNALSQVVAWAVQALAKTGMSIIRVYPPKY